MSRSPLLRCVAWAATVATALVASVAHAARFEVPVQGAREITLAVADMVVPAGDPGAIATTVRDTVERDLDLTGYFEIVPRAAHIERGHGAAPGTFAFDTWASLRTVALVKMELHVPGDPACDVNPAKQCVDVYVYDVLGGTKLAGKRVKANAADSVPMAHEIASVVLMALVGEPGFFGSTLVAVRTTGGNKEIWLVDVTGDHARPVTGNGAINLSPAWSPDRREVAWTSYRRGNPDVYVKDLASGAVRTLSDRPGLNISPSFSPDGRYVALSRSSEDDADIWLVDARTGKDVRRLTTGGGIDVSPSFSPDGSQIAFASERSGGSQIYVMPVTGGPARRVTPMAGFFTDPVWSPAGDRIAFVSRKGTFDILTIRTDGTGVLRITQDAGDNEDPSWSPDGKYLVFTSTRQGGRRIWLSTANGRNQVPLTTSSGWFQPVWSP